MIRHDRPNTTAYRVPLDGAAIEYLCDVGTDISTSSEVEIWIEVGDQSEFSPQDATVTGRGDIRGLAAIVRQLKADLQKISGEVIADPLDERRAKAYRWLERLGFAWDSGRDVFVRAPHN